MVTLACFATVAACSPISDVRRTETSVNGTSNADASTPPTGAPQGHEQNKAVNATVSTDCSQAELRRCGTGATNEVLVCRSGTWQLAAPCAEGETCVNGADGTGQCQLVNRDCATVAAGTEYCDASGKRMLCISATESSERACDALQRCVVKNDKPVCSCVPGNVDLGAGCMMATNCAQNNGGCDTAAQCIEAANGRSCGECPTGYTGDAAKGCDPQLVTLTPSCGQLDRILTTGLYNYQLDAPFVCDNLLLRASGPSGSRVEFAAEEVAANSDWTLLPVKVGETLLPVQVTSAFAVTTKYNLTIKRSGSQAAYIKAANADSLDFFGWHIAASQQTLAVGAPYEDSSSLGDPADNRAMDSGAAYLYSQQAGAWMQEAMLKADPVSAEEYFGSAVALDADTLVVGASGTDPLSYASGYGTRSGAAYVFVRQGSQWVQQSRLTPSSGNPGDFFGIKVAIQGDTLVVGAPRDAASGTRSGAAYVYKRAGSSWNEQAKLVPSSPSADGLFGFSTAIDGDRIIIGAPLDAARASAAGAAYIFVSDSGTWKEELRLESNHPAAAMTFGWLVAILGDMAVVTEPAVQLLQDSPPGKAHVYNRTGAWAETQELASPYPYHSDLFGSGVALTTSALVIGANGDVSSARGIDADSSNTGGYQVGAAYMYTRAASGSWKQSTYLKADNADDNDGFGQAVAIGADAVFVGAPNESSDSRTINAGQGSNGSSKSGAVYVFH